mmetsp:Transcript_77226/g.153175  ORF Transcript_77226/g.153175 Transcript_77226/m.153175 type:complete len:754 (-) Transcript_77226:35-2296(-)
MARSSLVLGTLDSNSVEPSEGVVDLLEGAPQCDHTRPAFWQVWNTASSMLNQARTNGDDWTEVHKLLQEQRQFMVETLGESLSRQTTAIERLTKQQTSFEAEFKLAMNSGATASRASRQTVAASSPRVRWKSSIWEASSSMHESDIVSDTPQSSRRDTVMQNLTVSAKRLHMDPTKSQWWKEEVTELRTACDETGLAFMNFVRRRSGRAPGELRASLKKVVRCPAFDLFFGLLILCNSVLIGVETQYNANVVAAAVEMETKPESPSQVLYILQMVFGVLFMIELLLRLGAEGREFVYGVNRRWNCFDTLLVLAFVVTFIIDQLNLPKTHGTTRVFRTVRFGRILRTVRLVRASAYAHEFRKMAFAMQHSALTLFWALLLLFFIIYVFATTFTQAATEHVHVLIEDGLAGNHTDISSEEVDLLIKYWGSLPDSLYSLYAALCGGYSWAQLVEPLDKAGWIWVILFLSYISIATFGAVNVVTSVFVESAMGSTQHFMDIKMQEALNTKRMHESHLQDLFNEVDADGSGFITLSELESLLGDPHFMVYLDTIDRKKNDAMDLFHMLDYDGSGKITKEEFCNGFLRLKGEAKSFDIHRLVMHSEEFMNHLSRANKRTYSTVMDISATLADVHELLYEDMPEKYGDLVNRSSSSANTVMKNTRQTRHPRWLPDDPAGWANCRPNGSMVGAAAGRSSSAPPSSTEENGTAPSPVARVLELVAAPSKRVGPDSSRMPWPSKKQVLRTNAQTVELRDIFEI